ncbi:MAG: hypothetical protein HY782_28940 [Chloroflexi bacterium]|nr:hypothetical protein [Chloroflexota bacterium]
MTSIDLNNAAAQLQKATEIEQDLQQLEQLLSEYQKIDARVLVSPFWNEVKGREPVDLAGAEISRE